jgi:hypothetical protein
MVYMVPNPPKPRDPRLDRLIQFDERSRAFPIRALLPDKAKPRSYSWPCGVWLDQGQEGACFPAGTLVRMADGSSRPIEDLKLLDFVVTAEGRTGSVLQTQVRMHNGHLARLRLRGHQHLKGTPEHPILTKRGYVPLKDLQVGDEVALTRHLAETACELNVSQWVSLSESRGCKEGIVETGGVLTEVSAPPMTIQLTPEFGRLIGLYLAEGATTANKVTWTFNAKEERTLVAETIDLIRSVLGAEARIQRRPNNSINVVLYGKLWRLLFERLFGTGSEEKHLSADVSSGPRAFLESLLKGWLSGDGYRRRNATTGVTISHRLAMDMHHVANSLGLRPTVRMSKPSMNRWANTRRIRWDLEFGNGLCRQSDQDDAAVWRKVQAVEYEPFIGYVYNLHIEGDESYVAEGVGVHNCVGFSISHEAAAKPVVVLGITNDTARTLYHRAQVLDDYPETPPEEGTSVLAGAKAATEAKWFSEYRWGFSLDDLCLAVGHHGPAVIGVNWYTGCMDTDSDGFVHVTGDIEGGHAILCRGVNVKKRYFTLRQSWGHDWGVEGDCRISFDDLDRLLHEQGEAMIPVRRANPAVRTTGIQ